MREGEKNLSIFFIHSFDVNLKGNLTVCIGEPRDPRIRVGTFEQLGFGFVRYNGFKVLFKPLRSCLWGFFEFWSSWEEAPQSDDCGWNYI